MYRRIMIVVDETSTSQVAIREGTSLAATHGAEAVYLAPLPTCPITMADAAAFNTAAQGDFRQAAMAKAEELLDGAMTVAEHAGVLARKTSIQEGGDTRAIVEAARRRRCDLIVVAADGHNAVMRLLNGSLIPGLITSSPVPVLVSAGNAIAGRRLQRASPSLNAPIPAAPERPSHGHRDGFGNNPPRYRRLLIVLEDTSHARAAVTEGIELARVDHAEVIFLQLGNGLHAPASDASGFVHVPSQHLLHALQEGLDRRAAAALRAADRAGVVARVLTGLEPLDGAGIAAVASQQCCDVVVIATDGRNAVARLVMGSVIPGLITASPLPVLVCHGKVDARAGGVKTRPRSIR
jgi:nucleotide-binding universal stress UspA family protein